MSKSWKIAQPFSEDDAKNLKGFSDIVIQMLLNRGVENKEEADDFFEPKYEKMHDPFLLKDMEKAVNRILLAIEKGERILIYGDYDVDGLTSTAIVYNIIEKLLSTLKKKGSDSLSFYIPHRVNEGYGLNNSAIDVFAQQGIKLIITVDNGISSKEQVSYASKRGIDIVVTDHHEPPKSIPKAIAVVNPKRKGDEYPFKDLAGVGVAFKLAHAMIRTVNEKSGREIISEGYLKWYLDLVALGTISDIVPLVGENRVIAHYGLIVLTKTKNIGLKALETVAGIDLKDSSPYMVGFQISPRLNAAGRLAHAILALELLLTKDKQEAGVLAMKLEKLNQERQSLVLDIVKEQRAILLKKEISNILVLRDDGWSSGIIGLVAGRISEEFSRPVFCVTGEKGLVKGSVRSSVDFDVVETLRFFEKVFVSYGGHKGAGGFSLKVEDFDIFYEQVVRYGESNIKEDDLVSEIFIDKEIEFGDITMDLFNSIKTLEPFGSKNEEPLFLTKGVRVKEAKKVGKDSNHTKLRLTKGGKEFGAILFNHGEMGEKLYYGKDIDIVYKIALNEWNGKKNIELKIEDLAT